LYLFILISLNGARLYDIFRMTIKDVITLVKYINIPKMYLKYIYFMPSTTNTFKW